MGKGNAIGQSAVSRIDSRAGIRFLPAGDTAVVVEFGSIIDPAINAEVRALDAALRADPPSGVIETVPTFRSLLVHYDPLRTSQADLVERIGLLLSRPSAAPKTGRAWRLPACYEAEFALDVDHVAEAKGLSAAEVIARHAATEFTVYMLGFLPGFIFLGGLPEALGMPRRTEPRIRVPAGSIAIAMSLSCIYPVVTPGGWHILGRSPVRLFDPRRVQEPTLIAPGDRVGFATVGRAEYDRIATAIETDTLDPAVEFRA
ncbi:MAG TPA: 5-oxoprolinase subunit PxpB [Stellaceae bacterium]|nr:5-oxoprolinase subunit PxpB [Stellaceae bacterium]